MAPSNAGTDPECVEGCEKQGQALTRRQIYLRDYISLVAEYKACVEHYQARAKEFEFGPAQPHIAGLESARRHCEYARVAIEKHRLAYTAGKEAKSHSSA